MTKGTLSKFIVTVTMFDEKANIITHIRYGRNTLASAESIIRDHREHHDFIVYKENMYLGVNDNGYTILIHFIK
jgi:hypothetical protein